MGWEWPSKSIQANVDAVWTVDVHSHREEFHPKRTIQRPDTHTGEDSITKVPTRSEVPDSAFPEGIMTRTTEMKEDKMSLHGGSCYSKMDKIKDGDKSS